MTAGVATLNDGQRHVFNRVTQSCRVREGGVFFIYSSRGCGRTYVCNLIAASVQAAGNIVVCVASSGIASLLFTDGRTAHSRSKIPIHIHEDSAYSVSKGNVHHELLKDTTLIIWDEVPMQNGM